MSQTSIRAGSANSTVNKPSDGFGYSDTLEGIPIALSQIGH